MVRVVSSQAILEKFAEASNNTVNPASMLMWGGRGKAHRLKFSYKLRH